MTNNLLKQTFRQKYNRINTQILNEISPRDATNTLIGQSESGEAITLKQGDVIAHTILVQNRKKAHFNIVLSTHENTGITVYDLDNQEYGFYPAELLINHLDDGDTEILSDLLPLSQSPKDKDSQILKTLLSEYDLGEVPHMPELPHGADNTLQITEDIEVTVGDVLYVNGNFEFILNTRGESDDEPQPDHSVIKYNFDKGCFGFYPVELLREDIINSNLPETEVLTDPWNIRSW